MFLTHLKTEIHSSSHTLKNYAIDLEQFLEFLKKSGRGDVSVHEIDAKDVRHLLYSLESIRPSSRSRKLSSIRSLFRFLFRRGLINKNITQFVSHPKKPKLLPKPVRMEQIFAYLSNEPPKGNTRLQDYKLTREYMVFAILFGCGLRISELCGLKRADISADFLWMRVRGKGNKERDIPIPTRLATHLRRYIALCETTDINSAYLFPGADQQKSITPRTVQRIIEHISGLSLDVHEAFTPHQLRHSFASHLLTSGANLKGIQELLGHQNLTSTEIYTHIHTQRLMEVMEKCHPTAQKNPQKKPMAPVTATPQKKEVQKERQKEEKKEE